MTSSTFSSGSSKGMVYIASDHAGFKLKEALVEYLPTIGYGVGDLGPEEYYPDDDYPLTVRPVADAMAAHPGSKGIVIGYSGQGEAMALNRVPGIRAAVYYGAPKSGLFAKKPGIIALAREHNDANVLSLGAGFLSEGEAKRAVQQWLETPFSGKERHARRIAQLQ